MKEFIEKLIGMLEVERNTAHNTYKRWGIKVDLGREFGVEKSIEIVNQLAEEYNNEWIPGSELPQEEDSYIVAWVPEHLPVQCASPHYYGIFAYENGEWSIDVPEEFKNVGIVILAWRELPEPYRG